MAVSSIEPVPLIIPSASNCVLWMRPEDTRSSNMTFSGNRLSAIKNLANSRTLIRNTVLANQPGTGVATINGLNAISFDNDNNRWLTALSGTISSFTIFFVVQQAVSAAQGVLFGGGGTSITRLQSNNRSVLTGDGTTGITLTGGDSYLTNPAIIAIVANAGTSTRNVYKNSLTIGATGAYDGSVSPSFFGSSVAVSGSALGGFNLGETVIYNKALSTAEISRIIRYLADKSGVILT